MKIFISWSGPRSRAVAKAMYDWLPGVIQAVEPFYSPEIERGRKWNDAIDAALQGTQFGIICLTPDNLQSPWIHYEAGALSNTQKAGASRKKEEKLIWTFLHGVKRDEVPSPLGDFEHTVATKEDVFRLIESINGRLSKVGKSLEAKRLKNAFRNSWPTLEKKLKAAETIPPTPGRFQSSADAELDKFAGLGIETVHGHLDDENIQKLLKGAKELKVLKTWFPESMQIAEGLKGAIEGGATIQLLLLKPGSELLKQRSLGAHQEVWWGSFMIYHAVDIVYQCLLAKKSETSVHGIDPGEVESKVRIGFYDSWPGSPVIWYDETILLGFYIRGKSSPSWPWLSVKKGSDLAADLKKQFDELWKVRETKLDTPEQMKRWLKKNTALAKLGVVPERSSES